MVTSQDPGNGQITIVLRPDPTYVKVIVSFSCLKRKSDYWGQHLC